MQKELGICPADWQQTPPAVRTLLLSLWQQQQFMQMRCLAYEEQLQQLRAQVAGVTQLQTEVAALRERLGQNSTNSSKPPSTDFPPVRKPPGKVPSGRRQGAQPVYSGFAVNVQGTA